jgi:uncharacterized membrane protein
MGHGRWAVALYIDDVTFWSRRRNESAMTLKQSIVLYLCTLAVMVPLDFIWLGFVARNLYASELGPILLDKPKLIPAALFYLIYAAGVAFFVVGPASGSGSFTVAALYGVAFGIVAYATYDLSNLATLRGFSTMVATIDILWGGVVTALSAVGGLWLGRLIGASG